MKRYLILAALTACLSAAINAQDSVSVVKDSVITVREPEPKLWDADKPRHFIEVKPLIAVGVSSILQNYSTAIPDLNDMLMSPGVMARGGVDVRFAITGALALGTGMAYDQCTSQYAMSLVESNLQSINSIYVHNTFSQIYVPVYVSLRFNLGRRMRWNIDLGGYYAKGLAGKMTTSGYSSGTNSIGQPVITHVSYKTKYFRDSQSLINGIKREDFGARIATGLTYKRHYSLNFIFETSVPNIAVNHDVLDISYRNYRILFEVGYNF